MRLCREHGRRSGRDRVLYLTLVTEALSSCFLEQGYSAAQLVDVLPFRGCAGLLSARHVRGKWHTRNRPEALIFASRHLVKGWKVIADTADQVPRL